MAFHNARSLLSNEGKGKVVIVIVANGPAVRFFAAGNAGKYAKQIEELVATGDVEIHVCGASLKAFGYKSLDVAPGCRVVPAGVLDIVKYEKQGYTYIKP